MGGTVQEYTEYLELSEIVSENFIQCFLQLLIFLILEVNELFCVMHSNELPV